MKKKIAIIIVVVVIVMVAVIIYINNKYTTILDVCESDSIVGFELKNSCGVEDISVDSLNEVTTVSIEEVEQIITSSDFDYQNTYNLLIEDVSLLDGYKLALLNINLTNIDDETQIKVLNTLAMIDVCQALLTIDSEYDLTKIEVFNESIDTLVFNNGSNEVALTDIGSPINNELNSVSIIDPLDPDGLALAINLIHDADEGFNSEGLVFSLTDNLRIDESFAQDIISENYDMNKRSIDMDNLVEELLDNDVIDAQTYYSMHEAINFAETKELDNNLPYDEVTYRIYYDNDLYEQQIKVANSKTEIIIKQGDNLVNNGSYEDSKEIVESNGVGVEGGLSIPYRIENHDTVLGNLKAESANFTLYDKTNYIYDLENSNEYINMNYTLNDYTEYYQLYKYIDDSIPWKK